MSDLSPVIWSEGMHLAQHHFQAQSRYFEARTTFALSSLYFRPWGISALELDEEALVNGTVVIRHARGVMPDGIPFTFPENPAPEPLSVSDLFSPTSTSARILLGIPEYRDDRPNVSVDGSSASDRRFVAASADRADDVTGGDVRAVSLARTNFRLLLDDESTPEGLVTLPIARVERDGSGRFVYAPEFVPPALRIAASPRLMGVTRGIADALAQKAQNLRERRAGGRAGSSGSVVEFWLAHAIQAGLAPLRHQIASGSAHPEELYRELARLGGALCTFAMDSHPRDLPAYDHDDLEGTFSALERHIRHHLDVMLPEKSISVRLDEVARPFHRGPLEDPRLTGSSARWFLGVRSDLARSEVLREVPRLIKVCSDDGIEKLVQRAYDGLPIEHVASPPPALSPKVGTEYFLLRSSGPCWKAITMSGGVGIYLPGTLSDAEIDLSVIFEE